LAELEEQLRLLQAECDSQKDELTAKIAGDERNERNEEALRQANHDIDSLRKTLEERDRDLSKLKAEVL
jgi:predicted  nucleic acid-binding Zn-ribbon protein